MFWCFYISFAWGFFVLSADQEHVQRNIIWYLLWHLVFLKKQKKIYVHFVDQMTKPWLQLQFPLPVNVNCYRVLGSQFSWFLPCVCCSKLWLLVIRILMDKCHLKSLSSMWQITRRSCGLFSNPLIKMAVVTSTFCIIQLYF